MWLVNISVKFTLKRFTEIKYLGAYLNDMGMLKNLSECRATVLCLIVAKGQLSFEIALFLALVTLTPPLQATQDSSIIKISNIDSRIKAEQMASDYLSCESPEFRKINKATGKLIETSVTNDKSRQAMGSDPIVKSVKECPEMTVSSLEKTSASTMLVDLRSKKEFARQHIPGSLNMSFFDLKAQTFLQTLTVVLVSDGFNENAIHNQCSILKTKGYEDVHVLRGGIYSWARINYSDVTAGSTRLTALSNAGLPSMDYFQGRDQFWIVVNQSQMKNEDIGSLLAVSSEQVMSAGLTIKALENQGTQLLQHSSQQYVKGGSNEYVSVAYLVLGSDEQIPSDFFRLYQVTELGRVFYLKDGVEGYQIYLARQEAMMRSMVARTAPKSLCSMN